MRTDNNGLGSPTGLSPAVRQLLAYLMVFTLLIFAIVVLVFPNVAEPGTKDVAKTVLGGVLGYSVRFLGG